jgi:3-hydroxyisobutyrate dehydrogenase-like beta-hydroxyacid dehydrogenase
MGLGQMGSALARCFIRHGHEVTVWNRDPEKRKAFEGSAAIAATPAEASAASEVIITCVASYAASDSFLHPDEVIEAAKGKTLVQFTSGSSPDARKGQEWARAHGIDYLDACVLGYPSDVDADHGWFFFSGPKAVFEKHAPVFETMSQSVTFVGEPVGCAAALDSALLGTYYMASIGLFHAASICQSEGMELDYFFDAVADFIPLIGSTAELGRKQIAEGHYKGTEATLDVHVAAQEHIVTVSRANGIDISVPEFVIDRCKKALAAGYGAEEIAALYETFKKKG